MRAGGRVTTRTGWRLLGVLLGLGVAAVAWWLVAGSSGGYLLRAEDIGPARVHMGLRERLHRLEAAAAEAPDDTSPEQLAQEAQRALLVSQIRSSRFAPLSDKQLREGLAAADRGEFHTADEDEALRGVYGPDDRLDREAVDEKQARSTNHEERTRLGRALELSRSVGAWMHRGTLRGAAAPWQIQASTLGRFWNLCSGERFADQPIAALGTAFLVGPDTVATAAHVVDRGALNRLVLVFDYETHEGSGPTEVREVYEPIRLLGIDASHATYDWAIVQLDRPVAGGVPLTLCRDTYDRDLSRDAPLYMWGHSAGTPKKFAPGTVRSNVAGSNSLRAILDAFGGDSGSPIFNERHEVVGMLFGGGADFEAVAARGGCHAAADMARSADGEYVTRVECFRGAVR